MEPRFLFHGEGSAANAIITEPTPQVIDVQAPSSLPIIGGTAQSRVENFAQQGSAGNVLSFSVGDTHALGYRVEKDGEVAWETVVTASVENLNILDVITADKVVGRLASKHPLKGHPTVLTIGSSFENLRIAGCRVDVNLVADEGEVTRIERHLLSEEHADSGFHKLFDRTRTAGSKELYPTPGVIGCTLVTGIHAHCQQKPFTEVNPGVIKIDGFGTIYLAELIAKPYERSLTMIRVELGSPPSGSAAVASTRTNGSPGGGK